MPRELGEYHYKLFNPKIIMNNYERPIEVCADLDEIHVGCLNLKIWKIRTHFFFVIMSPDRIIWGILFISRFFLFVFLFSVLTFELLNIYVSIFLSFSYKAAFRPNMHNCKIVLLMQCIKFSVGITFSVATVLYTVA